MASNKNGLGVEFISKKFKARSGEIRVVVHVNKVASPWMEKLNFLHMNLQIIFRLGKGDLDHVEPSPTPYVGILITLV